MAQQKKLLGKMMEMIKNIMEPTVPSSTVTDDTNKQ